MICDLQNSCAARTGCAPDLRKMALKKMANSFLELESESNQGNLGTQMYRYVIKYENKNERHLNAKKTVLMP